LERIDILASGLRGFRCETAALPDTAYKLLNDRKAFAQLMSLSMSLQEDGSTAHRSDSFGQTVFSECVRFCFKNVMYQNLLPACRFDEEYTFSVIDPAKHRVDLGRIKAGEESLNALRQRFSLYKYLLIMRSGSTFPLFSKFACAQTTIDQAVIACALERYRLTHSAFPDALDALVPQYLAKVPNDIINGQPLHYRRTEDGLFLLYSVGWNETDDNGVVGMAGTEKYRRQDIKQGDWVWRYPSSAAK